jgi:hypothetical protein
MYCRDFRRLVLRGDSENPNTVPDMDFTLAFDMSSSPRWSYIYFTYVDGISLAELQRDL